MGKVNLGGAIAFVLLLLSTTAWSQTATFTPNLTLTPPCSPSGTLGNSVVGTSGTTTDYMRGSLFNLSSPATIYNLDIYAASPPTNMQMIAGIYNGSAGSFGSLMVQSAAQTVVNGWNGMPVTPIVLAAGTYWLAYLADRTGYNATTSATGGANTGAFSTTLVTFSGGMPGTMPTPSYGTNKESIYAVYCLVPTNTPTITYTPTITPTPTNSFTPTITNTPTNTGTIFTNTPTATFTRTFTLTATSTFTDTPTATPNLSLTPSCGSSFASFGSTDISGSPVTAQSPELRACRYTLPVDGTIQTISLYSTAYSAGTIAEVAIYNNIAASDTVGSLVSQSVTQTLISGWNIFQVPSSPVTAGDYWLAYIYAAPVSYSLQHQASSSAVTTLAFTTTVPSWTFDTNASSYSLSYDGTLWTEPILANYCPGLLATPTSTSSPTITSTNTATNTATNTVTPTITGTPTDTATVTLTPTATNSPTLTFSPTVTLSPTDTASATSTLSPTNTVPFTATNSPTDTATNTATNSATNTTTDTFTATSTYSPTFTTTATATLTFTDSPTITPTPTITDTPAQSYTATGTATLTVTQTATNSATNTATDTATNSATNSATNTATNTATNSVTGTVTSTATNSATNTAANSATFTTTATVSATVTQTLTNSITSTASLTSTTTDTATPTFTQTTTPTGTILVTSTPTNTPTPAATNTLSMFPNPMQNGSGVNLRLNFNQPHDYVTIKVYTIALRKIFETKVAFVPAGTFSYTIAPNAFKGGITISNGLYYVVVTTPSDHWMSKLLVLN